MLDSASVNTISEDKFRYLFHAFLHNIPDHVYFKDLESRFIAVSSNLASKHGLAGTDQMLGKTDFDFFDEAHARQAFEDEQNIIRTGEPIIDKLEKEIWQTGAITWSLTRKVPLRNTEGVIIGTFGISRDVTASHRLQEQLENTHKELVDASRKAGMADVATGVLHNVGNVLNSVNVAAEVLADGLRRSRVDSLNRLAALLSEHAGDLPAFFATPKGAQIPGYLSQLADHLASERTRQLAEITELRKYIDHIKDVVTMQQSFASSPGLIEPNNPVALVEDSLRLNAVALARHEVRIIRDFAPTPPVLADRTRVLQIMVNLVRNAKHALDDGAPAEKRLTIRIETSPRGRVHIIVTDNGCGIPPENLDRIFSQGFTTRKTGHGFGLHSAANAAREMEGTLAVHSDGPGRGATFTLELPIAPATPAHSETSTEKQAHNLVLGPF